VFVARHELGHTGQGCQAGPDPSVEMRVVAFVALRHAVGVTLCGEWLTCPCVGKGTESRQGEPPSAERLERGLRPSTYPPIVKIFPRAGPRGPAEPISNGPKGVRECTQWL
jgi:hypothetical protein